MGFYNINILKELYNHSYRVIKTRMPIMGGITRISRPWLYKEGKKEGTSRQKLK